MRWSEKAQNLSRRGFLLAGGCALAIPLLESLPLRNAWASDPPRRLVFFWTPDGFERGTPLGWNPINPSTLTFARGSVLEPLQPFHTDLNLVEHLRLHGQGQDINVHYGIRQLLTGALYSQSTGAPPGGQPSLDQFVASHLRGQTRFPSLELGVASTRQTGADYGQLSYQAGGVAVARETDPLGLYKRLFLSRAANPGVAQNLYRQQKSILDAAGDDLTAIMSQVSAADRARLQAHADAYRDLERALDPANGQCAAPPKPADPGLDYAKVGQLQIQLLAMALQCDLTRVATLQWSYPVSNMIASFVGLSEDTHTLGHQIPPDWQAKVMKVQRWYASRFADLLGALGSATEGGSTVLGNSVVVWGSELDNNPQLHMVGAMPFLLAGQAGGYFRTGRIVDGKQRYVNDLLIGLSRAMGVEPPGSKFGDPSLCTGEIVALKA